MAVTAERALDLSQLKVLEAKPGDAGRTLLLTTRGTAEWDHRAGTVRLLAAATAFFSAEDASVGTFLGDGRVAYVSERGELAIFGRGGEVVRRWRRLPALTASKSAAILEDREGGLWIPKAAGLARVQIGEAAATCTLHGSSVQRRASEAPTARINSSPGPRPGKGDGMRPEG